MQPMRPDVKVPGDFLALAGPRAEVDDVVHSKKENDWFELRH